MHEVNVRVVRRVLERADTDSLRRPKLHRRIRRWMRDAAPLERYDRQAMTDSEVIVFIRRAVRKQIDVRHTRLLRQLRDSGRACEQKRFKRIFEQVERKHGLFAS